MRALFIGQFDGDCANTYAIGSSVHVCCLLGSRFLFYFHSDFIVTGGLDKTVKVWQFENNQLDLVHTLKSHHMGVVSVAVSSDGHSNYYFLLSKLDNVVDIVVALS